MNNKPSLWNTGHWPTLVCAFFYFDFSFMVWTVLGPLSAHIKEALHLSDPQTGMMVAVPSLGGAGLRLALGFLVDRIGAKNTGLIFVTEAIRKTSSEASGTPSSILALPRALR
jgi:NNP family nitrate/nitrite transporter-like MFS transporter